MLFNTPFPQLLKVAFLFSSLVSSHHQNAKILPKPNGPFGVSITTLQLTDPTRSENPFNLTSPSPRRLMISAITPTRHHQSTYTYPYMPPLTASLSEQEYTENYGFPNTTYSDLYLQVTDPQHSDNLEEWPLVLFSPAQGNTRLDYTFLASNIASHGFIVITLDHPYDGDIVEFPDQSYILGVPPRIPTTRLYNIHTALLSWMHVSQTFPSSSTPSPPCLSRKRSFPLRLYLVH
jgi:hypothetical protein